MKFKKILVLFLLLLSIFLIYKSSYKKRYYYLALGDGLSLGKNAYGITEYGYTGYLASYLEREGKLKYFSKDFSKSKYYIDELLNDLKYNKSLSNGHNLKRELREANLVTLSIGFDDLYDYAYSIKPEAEISTTGINNIVQKYKNLLIELKKYTKGQVLLIGYYNLTLDEGESFNELIIKFNREIKNLAKEENVKFIDVSSAVDNYTEYFPNPNVFYPNNRGYYQIYKVITQNINL